MVKLKSTSQNPFKFVSFSERIAKVSADITKWKGSLPAINEQTNTYFHDAITKGRETDFGSYFESFLCDIPLAGGELRTYAQLLHHQKLVFQAIVKHLSIIESTSLPTILDVTIAFVRDLREDFKPYLWDVFETIISIIENHIQDAEILELSFRALAVFFKLYWRTIVKELRRTFIRFENLFSSSRRYIRRFVSEAFAFLLRKSSNIGKVAAFMTETAKKVNSSSLADGISELYFNTLKGVLHQFHSSAPEVFGEIIDATMDFSDVDVMHYGIAILERAIVLCIEYTKKDFSLPLFDVVLCKYKLASSAAPQSEKTIGLSRLLAVWVTAKPKAAVTLFRDNLLEVLIVDVSNDQWEPHPEKLRLISSSILKFYSLPQSRVQVVSLLDSVLHRLKSTDVVVVIEFLSNFIELSIFDIFLMPVIGKYCSTVLKDADQHVTESVLGFYAKICWKRSGMIYGERTWSFDVSSHIEVRNHIVNILQSDANGLNTNLTILSYTCYIFPWFWRKAESAEGLNYLLNVFQNAMIGRYGEQFSPYLALFSANAILLCDKSILMEVKLDPLLNFLKLENCCEVGVQVLSLVLPFTKILQSEDQLHVFEKVANELLPFFGHYNKFVRQNALQILSYFKFPLKLTNDETEVEKIEDFISILLDVERTPLTLESYRDRLLLVKKLSYGPHKKYMPQNFDGSLELIPLRVIIAQLFEKFTIYWPQLHEVIESYGLGLDINLFWPIFNGFLEEATSRLNVSFEKSSTAGCKELEGICCSSVAPLPDYAAFRLELIKLLSRLTTVAERKTKYLSPLLISLFRDEYENGDLLRMNVQDISLEKNDDIIEANVELEEESDQQTSFDPEKVSKEDGTSCEITSQNGLKWGTDQKEKRDVLRKRGVIKKTLVALLEVFSNFKAPKSVYMSGEVRQLYDELIQVGNVEIQSVALKCIFSYGYKYLKPYRENFEKLINERSFLNELVLFGVDAQNSAIVEDHREQLTPLLMRVIYGKLNIHVSKDTVSSRRSAIFRFLAGCRSNELDVFIGILYSPLIEYYSLTKDMEQPVTFLCEEIISKFDVHRVFPLLRLQGSLNTLDYVIRLLSPALNAEQQKLIYRICVVASVEVQLSLSSPEVNPKFLNLLKNLRASVCKSFREFFFAYQKRKYSFEELNALFVHFIGPTCDATSYGNVLIAPLNVLRLFFAWSQMPLLFDMFRVRIPSQRFGSSSVIAVMCSTLNSNSASSATKESVLDAILNLLTMSDEGLRDFPKQLDLIDVKPLEDVNFGTAIVLSESRIILDYVYKSLPSVGVKKAMNMKHLEIVNRLATFVTDGVMARNLIITFLTYIGASCVRGEEVLQQMLATICWLVKAVDDLLALLIHMVKLQSSLTSKDSRLGMVNVLKAVAIQLSNKSPEISIFLEYICDLDAWDLTKIDEPDYEKRHSAYTNINKALEARRVLDVILVQLMAHNHFFNATESKDMSVRDSASYSFRRLIEFVGGCSLSDAEKLQLLEKHFIPLVLKGIGSSNEMIRNEFIFALVSMVTSFPCHKQLCQLSALRDSENVDLDFFANVSHLQLHRRQRAFRRVAESLKSDALHIHVDVLIRFILPLLQPYINELNSNTSALSDEALHLFRVIMEAASWKSYWRKLEYYMNRLSANTGNKKAILRVIIALVEAFHFNVDSKQIDDYDGGVTKGQCLPVEKDGVSDSMDGVRVSDVGEKDEENEETGDILSEEALSSQKATSGDSVSNKVLNVLLPKLQECAVGKSIMAHRKAGPSNDLNEDEIIERAPVALATVKLLQKMPAEVLDQYLEGVVLKLCDLLMSRSIHVRDCARKTLIEIVKILGPKYLPFVICEVKVNLLKGYQIHVMIYSTHSLISAMQDRLTTGDLDGCLEEIIEICKKDLFSDVTEEKEVDGIVRNVPEAKGNRTFETYALLGRFISPETVGLPVSTLKEVIESKPTAEVIRNVNQLLRNYAFGLSANIGIDALKKVAFAYHMIKDHIDGVLNPSFGNEDGKMETQLGRREQSCLLLDKEPERVGVIKAKTSLKSRMFVFIEFGLQVLGAYLKVRKHVTDSAEDIAQLDPFVPLIAKCLELKFDKTVSNALRCFTLILKYPLPSLKTQIQTFVDHLFILLAEYSSMGAAASKGVVFELTILVFKAITQMIKDAPTLVLTPKRLQLLLNYVEADVMDSHKQATAFSLIKAIIGRKLQDPKVKELIYYLSEVAITSELPHIRIQCRQVLAQFIGRHPQSDKPKVYIAFFLNQLEYEHEFGRISAIEMLNVLFENLDENAVSQSSMLAFVKMAVRLVNDDSAKCRRLVALSIRKLLSSISEARVSDIYLCVRDWLESRKEENRRIAMLVIVEFVEVFGENFAGRLTELIPLLSDIFHQESITEYTEPSLTTMIDSYTLLLKKCPDFSKKCIDGGQLNDIINKLECFIKCSQSNAIQLSSSRFIGQIFALASDVWLSTICDTCSDIVQWMCWQLKSPHLTLQIAEQASKNLVYLLKVYATKNGIRSLGLLLRGVCNREIVKHPTESLRRSSVLKILAAFVVRGDADGLDEFLDVLFPYVFREMNPRGSRIEPELQKLAMEVGDIVKQKVGQDVYSKMLKEAQVAAAKKAEKRKMLRKEEAVTDPVKAAINKQKKTKKRIAARKRKAIAAKPYKAKKYKVDD